MAITIGGIRVTKFEVSRADNEEIKVSGNYSLVSNTGTVLAKQSFNGYNDIVLNQSVETQNLRDQLLASVKRDLNKTLGLEE